MEQMVPIHHFPHERVRCVRCGGGVFPSVQHDVGQHVQHGVVQHVQHGAQSGKVHDLHDVPNGLEGVRCAQHDGQMGSARLRS